jgi:tripartite-type tricarboxylate transporter receptor subunit TctC
MMPAAHRCDPERSAIDGLCRLALCLAAALLTAVVAAQEYPSRTIRIVVPFPPGGATDVVTRIVAQKLSDQMGRQVVTENRGGAGGIVGVETVAKAAPDGYSLVMGTTGTHAINASLYPKLAYDPLKDFAPVSRTALLPNMIVAHPSVPAKSVRELIALAKKNPGGLTYASSGSALYLSGALFTSMAGVEMLHVPYKGGGQSMPALLGGEVALSFATVVSSLPHVKAGKLRAIAVTSARRTPAAPEYPTVSESGLPGYEAVAWYGVLAPAGTPRDIIARLNGEIVRSLRLADVQQLLLAQGAEAVSDTPDEFAAIMRKDIAKWGSVVRKVGAKAD